MSALTVAEVLDGAAKLLEKPGAWAQNIPYQHNGCFCMVGAMQAAANAASACDVERGPISAPVYDVLVGENLMDDLGGEGLHVWNDAPGRTQAEVVAKLREAAALARESEK